MRFAMQDGQTFVTYKADPDAEVYGWLEDRDGKIVNGTGGWWRTEDEADAADEAEARIRLGLYGRAA